MNDKLLNVTSSLMQNLDLKLCNNIADDVIEMLQIPPQPEFCAEGYEDFMEVL
jgi:hypothetical protein